MLCWPSGLPTQCSPLEQGSRDPPRHTVPSIAWAGVGAGCSGRDPEHSKKHCVVFHLTLLAAHLCEANRTLKVASRALIFLVISFQGKGFGN